MARAAACAVEVLEQRRLLAAQLVADLNTTSHFESTDPGNLVASGGKLFFWGGWDLWATDGTPGNARLLPGHLNYPTGLPSITDVNGAVFFSGGTFDPAGGELWRSDGTDAGTYRVKDINPGPAASDIRYITNFRGAAFFSATGDGTNYELWKSDGTAGGTVRVKDVRPGPAGADPRSLTPVGDTLFFVADDGTHGYELWKTNGTDAGTVLVRDINLGPATSGPSSLTNVNGALYFAADDGFGGHELWRSDGTAAGTYRVRDVRPGQDGSAPTQLTNVNGTLFFIADDGARGYELWKSNGTEAGTVLVRDIITGSTGTGLSSLTASGGKLYFAANDGYSGLELWKSDGTAAGTLMVKDVRPGALWYNAAPARLTDVNGTLFFTAYTDAYGMEVWKSDGTAAGTVLARDVRPGPVGSQPWSLLSAAAVGDAFYFSAHDGETYKVFRSDRVTGATAPVAEVSRRSVLHGSDPGSFVTFNGVTLFAADNGVRGRELWRTDGTAAGTVLVKDIVPGPGGSSPSRFVNAAGTLFFVAGDAVWRTDGTAAGTLQVGPFSTYYPSPQLVAAGSRVFFRNVDAAGDELWVSDGTPGGARRVKDIAPGAASARVFEITALGNVVYFVANDGVTGDELWRSDGTAAGTYLVRDLMPGAASSGPAELEAFGGTLFFRASNGTGGWELYKTDGTAGGTVLVEDINPGPANSGLGHLTAVGGAFLFTADDGVNGNELWRSDGTWPGTYMVKDIYPGRRGSGIHQVVAIGDTLYFRADDGSGGYELWKSDGTFGGTIRVKDINPGPGSSTPINMTASGGTLFFHADNGGGWRLWQSDGTAAGTFPTPDANYSVSPFGVMKSGQRLLFSSYEPDRGYELWKADFHISASPSAVVGPASAEPPVAEPLKPAPSSLLDSGAPEPLAGTETTPAAGDVRVQPAGASALLPGQQPLVYDAVLFYSRPRLTSFSMPYLYVSYGGWNPDGDAWIADEGRVREVARAAASAGDTVVFDIEHWPVDVRTYSDGEVQKYVEQLGQIVDWAHDERPGLKVGFYGLMPLTDYWAPVGGDPARVRDWQAANRRLQPLADKVDLVFPSLYAFFEDRYGWQAYAQANLTEALKYGKPVAPFLGMIYHESEADVRALKMPADYWQTQLQTVTRFTDRIVLWGGFLETWDDRDAWWAVTREFLAPKRLAAEIAKVTPEPRAVGVQEMRVTFTRPVSGFDLSDLSLTRDGGANLLAGAQGVILNSSDGASWTLTGLGGLTSSEGTYTLTLTGYGSEIRDAAGAPLAAGTSESFRVDFSTPAVAVGSFDLQSARQLRFAFSKDVSVSLDPSDLMLVNRVSGAAVQTSSATVVFDLPTLTATFTLPARLANGDYRATLRAVGVYDPAGVRMAADAVVEFWLLTGDINRDRAVNTADFTTLASNFGKSGKVYADGDLTGDGIVNTSDFILLSGNFGRTLPAPPAALVEPASLAAAVEAQEPTSPAAASAPKKKSDSTPRRTRPRKHMPPPSRAKRNPGRRLAASRGLLDRG